ncbi:MAG TPA: glycosyltransferase family A protein, partial [Saprospiraceae bacterium]|nr:glycosyltransferase family A protein [Saprospiraceae bacterium]
MHLSIIAHIPPENGSGKEFITLLDSIAHQIEQSFSLILLGEADAKTREFLDNTGLVYHLLPANDPYSEVLNQAFGMANDFILYIDNRSGHVILKQASLITFRIAAQRNSDAAFFYGDYELVDGENIREVKLLTHHIGRVRDNQDYGKVFFIRKQIWVQTGGFDPKIEYNHWYDMRLKLSCAGKLVCIGNKYSGSMYRVFATNKTANVFDYLLAGKQVQLEAEQILNAHLKRLGAWMKPGEFFEGKKEVKPAGELDATVIIPVGYRPEFISTAIESIQKQTVRRIEAVIVVNGGSNDPTADEVRKYMKGGALYDPDKPDIRLLLIDINNIGLCLNLGAGIARGKYYVQLDSDDRLKPDAVEKILHVFSSDPSIGMVIGSYEVWEKKENGNLVRMEEIPVVTHDEWTEDNGRNNLLRINGAGAPRSIPITLIREMGYFSVNDDAFAR